MPLVPLTHWNRQMFCFLKEVIEIHLYFYIENDKNQIQNCLNNKVNDSIL